MADGWGQAVSEGGGVRRGVRGWAAVGQERRGKHERARERERERQRQRQKRSGSARGRAEREKARQEREPPPLTFVLPYKYVGKRAINRDGATDREARQSDCLAPPVAMTLRSYPHPTRAVIKGS